MTMAMDADVRLLIGVARGGADGDSEALIRKELAEIMKNIKAKDIDNNVDIPQQGVIYIHNNINKEFVRR